MNQTVIIIGAGPVGLHTALHLLQKNQTFTVQLFETREFTRKQIVIMSIDNWNNSPIGIKEYVKNHNGLCIHTNNRQHCLNNRLDINKLKYRYRVSVQLNILQSAYLHYLQTTYTNRFQFIKKDITFEKLINEFEDVKIVILADGVNKSNVSSQIPLERYHLHVSNTMVATFDCKLKKNKVDKQILSNKKQNSLLSYFIKHTHQPNQGSAYIALQLSNESFDKIKQSNYAIDTFNKMPEYRIFHHFLSSVYDPTTEIILFFFPIVLHTTSQFYYHIHNKYFFFVGDTAYSTHFFTGTGMNNGLDDATFLVNLIGDSGNNLNLSLEDLATKYNTHMNGQRYENWYEIVPNILFNMGETYYTKCKNNTTDIDFMQCVYQYTESSDSNKYASSRGKRIRKILLRKKQTKKLIKLSSGG